jgi:hypothetical protein
MSVLIDAAPVQRWLISSLSKLKNPAPILRAAVMVIGHKDVMDHFRKKQGPNGSWVPRKQQQLVTIRRGPRKGETINKPLLEDTGNLRGNFMSSNTYNVDNMSVKYFNPVPYSGYQDRGTKYIPSRKFMWYSNDAMDKMAIYVLEQLVA